ncbi:Spermidine synthase [Enhygromyxa salina]|uniref:Spermidine synthase n=1 Tax=Enhygromyxa salina TaxID=215803 RepID=A0A2S9XZJ7_9BACT|nr:fused MFS/spermidine synthase [Enhygromyxa salina]PRP98269.1 Spermidine synthase [Enhygromyxa salina]
MSSSRRAAFVALFFVSGLCGLGYEIVWLRLVAGIVGVGIYANAIVLATFMLGLGLGALAAGRWLAGLPADRLLRAYVRLELALGAWALVVPVLTRGLGSVLADLGAPPGSSARLLISLLAIAAVLLPATTLMGATLPVLTGAVAERDRTGRWLGILYGLNTLGAVLGTVVGGWLLVPALGLSRASVVLVAGNWAVAGVAKLLARGVEAAAPERVETQPEGSARKLEQPAALVVAGVSGLMGIGLELTWMRGLAAHARDTVGTMVLTLAGMLLGLALGGLLGGALASSDRAGPRLLGRVAVLQAAAAAALVLGPLAVGALAGGPGKLELDTGFGLAMVALAVVPGAVASGATLPLAAGVLGRRLAPARAAGRVLAANTAGCVIGALATGLWWIPSWGTRGSTLITAGLVVAATVVASAVALRAAERERGLVVELGVAGLLVAATGVGIARLPVAPHMPPRADLDSELLFSGEDAVGLVEVLDRRGAKYLITDRTHAWGSDEPIMLRTMRRQGYLPLLLHPEPARVLEVGLATGVQFAPYLRHPAFERGVIVEISPAVAAAAREFDEVADHVLDDARVELLVADGRDVLRSVGSGELDVIVLGLFTAYRPGVSDLYSEDLYRVAVDKLGPGGLLVQWLPLDQLSDEALRAVIRSFRAAAPEVHAFEKDHYLALVGSREPLEIEWSRVEALVARPEIRDDLRAHGLLDPYGMLGSHVADGPALDALAGDGPHNTDDRPYVEFHPPPRAEAGVRYAQASRSLEALLKHHVSATTIVVGLSDEQRQRLGDAGRARVEFLRGAIAQVRGEHDAAAAHFGAAFELNPDDRLAAMAARQSKKRQLRRR